MCFIPERTSISFTINILIFKRQQYVGESKAFIMLSKVSFFYYFACILNEIDY